MLARGWVSLHCARPAAGHHQFDTGDCKLKTIYKAATHASGTENLIISELGAGATLYLPVLVPGAKFYTGDPHMNQGDGEVALTALELSQRPTFRLTLLKKGDARIPSSSGTLTKPFAETKDYWIAIGLNPDLDDAMKDATRESVRFLSEQLGMDRATALAYLSAATTFAVTQVVDKTKGVHALIQKSDFAEVTKGAGKPK